MLNITRQKKARSDLKEIWLYSYENWGIKIADQYLDDLETGFQMIARNPDVGTSCDHISKGLRKLPVKRHLVVYRTTSEEVRIIRVLGIAMDYENHL